MSPPGTWLRGNKTVTLSSKGGVSPTSARSNYSKLKLPVIYKKGGGKGLRQRRCLSPPPWILKKKGNKTARSLPGSKKNSPAWLPAPVAAGSWGVRMAAGSGPRDDLKKRLKLMKIRAIFLGAVLSKCKCLRVRALPGRGGSLSHSE